MVQRRAVARKPTNLKLRFNPQDYTQHLVSGTTTRDSLRELFRRIVLIDGQRGKTVGEIKTGTGLEFRMKIFNAAKMMEVHFPFCIVPLVSRSWSSKKKVSHR